MKNKEQSGFYPPLIIYLYVYLWFVNSLIASCHKTRVPRPINGLRTFNTLKYRNSFRTVCWDKRPRQPASGCGRRWPDGRQRR